MSGQAYHWKEGDAHKVGRKVLLGGAPHKVGKATLMQECHTMKLAFVPTCELMPYEPFKAKQQEARA